jgi:hypothetical protein
VDWGLPICPITHLSKEPEARWPCWAQPSVFLLELLPDLYNLKNSECKELYLTWWQEEEYLPLFVFLIVILRCDGLVLQWLVPVYYMECQYNGVSNMTGKMHEKQLMCTQAHFLFCSGDVYL